MVKRNEKYSPIKFRIINENTIDGFATVAVLGGIEEKYPQKNIFSRAELKEEVGRNEEKIGI